jgi:hypothetical protein
MKDDIIQEVWKAKNAVAARHDHDVKHLVERLRSAEKSSGSRMLDLHARQSAGTDPSR